jgi:hypothetical protein
MKAGPDLGLPPAMEALDSGLKASLTGRDKDGHHLQAEAQAHHRTDHVRMLVRALEARVIIELGIIGQPELAPMPQDRLPDGPGVEGRARPRAHQPPCSELVLRTSTSGPLDEQSRNDIEQVNLSEGGSYVRQIPGGGRSGTVNPGPGVQSLSPLEDPINRGQRGDALSAMPEQVSANGGRPKLSQVTLSPQVASNRQHPLVAQVTFERQRLLLNRGQPTWSNLLSGDHALGRAGSP